MSDTPAQSKLRKKVEGWKDDKVQKDMAEKTEVENSLVALSKNKEMMDMYNDSAKMGSGNTQEAFPTLKLHVANKSRGNTLMNGDEPSDGYFFHTKTKSQFKEPLVHVLSISRGFRAKPQKDPETGMIMIDKETGKPQEPKFTQLLSGVICDGEDYQPFIMYFTGGKLNNLWAFGRLIKPFTNLKPVAIPMFAMTVKFSREKIDSRHGPQSIVKFDLVRDEANNPVLVGDPGKFVWLRELVQQTEEVIESMIKNKEIGVITSQDDEGQDISFPPEEE